MNTSKPQNAKKASEVLMYYKVLNLEFYTSSSLVLISSKISPW